MTRGDTVALQAENLETPRQLNSNAITEVAEALNLVLADLLALYLKTKSFHWHVSGPHFREYHLLFDEQAEQVLAATDAVAERVRKIGGTTIRSIGHVGQLQRISDNDAEFIRPAEMLVELLEGNKQLATYLRGTHDLCERHEDIATASLLENWIDEAERRIWFLSETGRIPQ